MTAREVALPDDYPALLADLKTKIASARQVAVRTVNTQLIMLYWTIGQAIVVRQAEQAGAPRSSPGSRTTCAPSFPT